MADLPAGPELDALVAEKVMGWEPLRGKVAGAHGEGVPEDRQHLKCVWDLNGKRMACAECGTLPHFSTSIGDAWEVVEKVKEWRFSRRHRFMLALQDEVSKTLNEYGVGVRVAWEGIFLLITPYAICLAALRAVGDEDG